MSPFTEYMNKLELEAISEDDICARDETLDEIFPEDHALGVGGGAASAGCTAATPQEGGDLAAARAMVALSFVHDANVKIRQLKIDESTNPPPVCSGFERGAGAYPQDINQKPPADEGNHAPLKKTPCQSIIGCDDTGIFLKKAPIVTKKERKKTLYKNSANLPKVSLIVAFYLNTHCHHLNPCLNCALSKSLSNSPSSANIIPSKTALSAACSWTANINAGRSVLHNVACL